MKKLLLGLLALSSLAFAKEAMPAPVKVAEPAYAPMAAPYLTLRLGADMGARYDKANLGYNPDFILGDFLDTHSGVFGKSLNDKKSKGFEFEVAAEYMYPVHQLPGLELGLGIAFQRHGKMNPVRNGFSGTLQEIIEVHFPEENVNLGDLKDIVLNINTEREIPSFDSLPLYVVGKYKFDNWDMWGTGATFYLKGDLGWSYNMKRGETKSRTYVGLSNIPENELTIPSEVGAAIAMDGHSKVENGLYWGAGFGVEYDNWTVDLMYKVNTAKVKGEYRLPVGTNPAFDNKVSSFSQSLDYSRVTLSLGYKF